MAQNATNEARIGHGSEFWLGDATLALVELEEVTEVALPEEAIDDVEVTHMKSPGRRKEFKPGLADPGEGSVTLNYIPGSATDILIRGAVGKVRPFKTVLPDEAGAAAWKVEGNLYIKSRSRTIPIGDRMQTTLSVRFTGPSAEGAAA